MEPHTKGWNRVINLFGREILNDDETLNREKLGDIIFHDSVKRKELNRCLHSLIAFEMIKEIMGLFIRGFTQNMKKT